MHANVAAPLAGRTIAVTSDRRRDELVELLRRRGATVLEAPTLRIVPVTDDSELRRATERCLEAPLDFVLCSTGAGWRGWMQAAADWGYGDALLAACQRATVLSRGAKATGAVRASGLRESWSPPSETSSELLNWLLQRDLSGQRVAIQEHGRVNTAFTEALEARGADTISVPVYQWVPPVDRAAVQRLIDEILDGGIDAVTFTSAPAVTALVEAAAERGLREDLLRALDRGTLAACIGPVCAGPLQELGVRAIWPKRGRLAALVRVLTENVTDLG